MFADAVRSVSNRATAREQWRLLETWDSTPVTGGRSSGKICSPPLRCIALQTVRRCIATKWGSTELRCARVALSSLVIYEILSFFTILYGIPNGFRIPNSKKHIGFSFVSRRLPLQTLQTCDKHPQTSLKSHVHLRNLYWFPSHTGHTHVVYHVDLYDLCGLSIFYPCLPSISTLAMAFASRSWDRSHWRLEVKLLVLQRSRAIGTKCTSAVFFAVALVFF